MVKICADVVRKLPPGYERGNCADYDAFYRTRDGRFVESFVSSDAILSLHQMPENGVRLK